MFTLFGDVIAIYHAYMTVYKNRRSTTWIQVKHHICNDASISLNYSKLDTLFLYQRYKAFPFSP